MSSLVVVSHPDPDSLTQHVARATAQAIRAATVGAAELLGRGAELGTIEPGKAADLIAVGGSPLEDVTRLEHVGFVMHRGAVAPAAR